MNLCKDCKFFDGSTAAGDCKNPGNTKLNYITGAQITRMYPQDLREIQTYCGPDAKWFEGLDSCRASECAGMCTCADPEQDLPTGPMGGMYYGRATGRGV